MGDNERGLRYWRSQRLTRRRLLGSAAVGAAGVAAIGLVGCSSKKSNPTETTTAKPTQPAGKVNDGTQDGPGKPGGTMHLRQTGPLPSMKPFGPSILALAQGLVLGFTAFDHMWYVPTDTGVMELFLATKVEQPDPLTVIATIGDAVFHDKKPVNGRKVVAEDIAASFKRFRDEIPFGYDWHHNVMDDIVAVDDHTVKITQKFPWAWVFTSSNAGNPWTSSILPKEILHDDDLMAKDAIGSGAWVLDSHDNGANIQWKKFQNFRNKSRPLLDAMDWRSITDDVAGLAAFKAGQIDAFGFNNKTDADDTRKALGDKINVTSDLQRNYMCLMLKYEPPFTDERVRHAINLLIDRDEVMQLLVEGSGVKSGPLPPAHKKYVLPDDDKDLQEYFRHDVADAKKLLDAASFNYDQEIELKHSTRAGDAQLSQILKAQLARGGVKVNLAPEDLVKWFSQSLGQSNFHMTAFEHLAYEDPDLPLRFFLGAEGDRKNFMQYKDPKVDEAVLAAAKELDETARIEKVRNAQRVIIQQWAPMLNIYSEIGFGARYNYVKGAITGRGSLGAFNQTTWLDKS
ncbi:MAG: ABC transporter substrate-binding protein [Chloroflexota bacterium]|nr:ABC transporter substrate-binding protein [Chloroflexota bacterium]